MEAFPYAEGFHCSILIHLNPFILKNIYLIAFLLVLSLSACQDKEQFDLVILKGTIIDGTGEESYRADLAIKDDTIAFIGDLSQLSYAAAEVIDANSYTVTPGFIDPHTHAMDDLSDSVKNQNLNYLMQGVTTVVTGSDGGSVLLIGDKLREWEERGIGTNAAIMVGHRTIRRRVMSMRDEEPTAEELRNMKTLVARGMDDGALGFSTGLYYAPASFATTEEVIELAKVAAEKGGMYDAHIRDESSYNIGLLAAIEETIEIGKKANIPVHISHIKCLGVDVWGQSAQAVELVAQARATGQKVTADQYPYRASGTHLDKALLPRWAFADGLDFETKFKNPTYVSRLRIDVLENLRRRGGPESLLMTFSRNKEIQGKTLAEISEAWGLDPVETALKIIENGSATVASYNMQEEDIQYFMKQDWVMTSSDGTNAHPRKYGSFPKKIREHVFEKKVLSLEDMIRRSTGLTAETFGVADRGKILEGYKADILVFHPEEINDNADFIEPDKLAEGMHWVVLNGQLVIEEGAFQGQLAGQVVRR